MASVIAGAEEIVSDESLSPETETNMKRFTKRLGDILDTGEMSDFKIVVEEQSSGRIHEVKVHKLVLLTYDYFKAAITCNMKEETENKIVVNDFSYDVVLAMLEFMYTSRVKPESWKLAEDLFKASDKYGMAELNEMCAKRLESRLNVNNIVHMLRLGTSYNCSRLKDASIEFIRKNPCIVSTDEWQNLKDTQVGISAAVMELFERTVSPSKRPKF